MLCMAKSPTQQTGGYIAALQFLHIFQVDVLLAMNMAWEIFAWRASI